MKRIITTLKEKWPEYLLEILVLIIGIYGAFAVEEWGENKSREKEEIEILEGCKTELYSDLKDIKLNISELKKSLKSMQIILRAFDQDLPYHDSLSLHFNYTLLPIHFVHSTSTFETLKSKGLGIISNDTVRNQLIKLYDSQYKFFLQGESEEIVEAQYNFRQIITPRFESGWDFNNDTFEGEMIPLDFEALKSDHEYLFFLKTQQNRTEAYVGYFYKNLESHVHSMISTLESEIRRIAP